MKPFNFEALREAIVEAAKEAYLELTQAHPKETFVGFALYTDDGAMTVCAAMNTQAFLAEKKREEPDDSLLYKYETAEWPYEGVGADEKFGMICDHVREHVFSLEDDETAYDKFKDALIETCVKALEDLRRNFFADMGEDFLLLFNISDGDEPKKVQIKRIARLNSMRVADEFKSWSDSWS